MTAPADVLADLRSVIRIAKAASFGVTGNGPRIGRAERALDAVAELIAANVEYGKARDRHATAVVNTQAVENRLWKAQKRLAAALARVGGAK